jgi:hypothetical protein
VTLVVAECVDNRIILAADTKITWSRSTGNPVYQHAQAKVVIITSQLAIAFAGDQLIAREAVASIRSSAHEHVVHDLAASSTDGEVEYLVVDLDNCPRPFVRLRHGLAEKPSNVSWLGDPSALRSYQQAQT